MSAKIINPNRYKKTTRKKAAKSKLAQKESLKYRKDKLKNIKEKKNSISKNIKFNQPESINKPRKY